MRPAAALALALTLGCGRSDLYEPRINHLPPQRPDAGRPNAGQPDAGNADAGFDAGVAATLAGLRWELPCVQEWPNAPEYVCVTTPPVTTVATLGGRPSQRYEIGLHFRGVVELKEYPGGQPISDAWNIYRLDVSSPPQTFHLNEGRTGQYACYEIDRRLTLIASGGATFTLFASAVDDNRTEIRNRSEDGGAIVPAGVPPAPRAFDGQFLQMDVESVRLLP